MNSTALGAEKENINFISEAHEKFYYEKIQKVREADVYHKALCYCIGMNEDTRRNVDRIYNFKTGCVKPECLHEGWQTSGSAKVVRMAFNLYCNGTPSVDDEQDTEEQVDECRRYSVEDLFCCCYAPYFWQAIQIRYPEYATYNKNLYAIGGKTEMLRPKEVVQLWVDAFNKHDVEAITALYHENATNHQVANEPVVGIEAIRTMFTAEFSTSDMTAIVENIFEDGQWAILEWRDPLGLRGCGFFQVVNGKILFQRGYWDKLSFLKQHNLPIE